MITLSPKMFSKDCGLYEKREKHMLKSMKKKKRKKNRK
jgi:hypothetical protein